MRQGNESLLEATAPTAKHSLVERFVKILSVYQSATQSKVKRILSWLDGTSAAHIHLWPCAVLQLAICNFDAFFPLPSLNTFVVFCLPFPFVVASSNEYIMSLHNLQLLFFRFSISLLLASLLVIPHVRADCYTFNGTLNPDPDYQPCDSIEGSTSMCCATNRTTDGNVDVCLPNGLCQNFGLDSEGNKIPDTNGGYWRETCSDQSWKSPYCLKLCISSGE